MTATPPHLVGSQPPLFMSTYKHSTLKARLDVHFGTLYRSNICHSIVQFGPF